MAYTLVYVIFFVFVTSNSALTASIPPKAGIRGADASRKGRRNAEVGETRRKEANLGANMHPKGKMKK